MLDLQKQEELEAAREPNTKPSTTAPHQPKTKSSINAPEQPKSLKTQKWAIQRKLKKLKRQISMADQEDGNPTRDALHDQRQKLEHQLAALADPSKLSIPPPPPSASERQFKSQSANAMTTGPPEAAPPKAQVPGVSSPKRQRIRKRVAKTPSAAETNGSQSTSPKTSSKTAKSLVNPQGGVAAANTSLTTHSHRPSAAKRPKSSPSKVNTSQVMTQSVPTDQTQAQKPPRDGVATQKRRTGSRGSKGNKKKKMQS